MKPEREKILVAGRLRLAIPQRLFFNLGGGQFGDALEADHRVAQIGDGGVAVLEIEAFEEFLAKSWVRPIRWNRVWNRASGCSAPEA